MALNAAGIKAGWKIEKMPVPRIMSVAVVLPTGDVLITGGAQTGSAGYDDARNKVGHSGFLLGMFRERKFATLKMSVAHRQCR